MTTSDFDRQEQHRQSLFFVAPEYFDATAAIPFAATTPLHRINALMCCKGAEHGWPGASFSCVEILMALHFEYRDKISTVILSKGHAAAAQYAMLHAQRTLPNGATLADYKRYDPLQCPPPDSPWRHLEAHADLHCDTGSLGTCLSTVVGMAIATPTKLFAIVLGDGELQEGQNYEALMTINHYGVENVLIVVDRNGFQSDNRCDEMMKIHDLEKVLQGFGFPTAVVTGGNDLAQVSQAVSLALERCADGSGLPTVLLCDTTKGAGTKFMPPEPHPVTKKEWQPWHTKIPSWTLCVDIVEEQLAILS